MKRCSRCYQLKPDDMFYRQSGSRCRPCHNAVTRQNALDNPARVIAARNKYSQKPENKVKELERARRWQRENPERMKAAQFERNLRKLYGLTLDQYHARQESQDFCCAICDLDDRGNLYVDHDHKTKRIRGLLCNQCNTAVGLMQDNPNTLQRAAQYVSM